MNASCSPATLAVRRRFFPLLAGFVVTAASVDITSPAHADVRRTPEVAPESVGFNADRIAAIDSLIRSSLKDGAAPGAALVIGRHGKVVRMRGYGRTDWDPFAPAVTDSTLYDLASLTKAMGTATVALQMINEGRIRLDAYVHTYLPSWPKTGPHGQIRVRHLLSHTSGLPAGSNLWPGTRSRRERLEGLASLKVVTRPGLQRNYSDVGMILLGFLLEEVSGSRLDDLLYVRVASPLSMRDTRFNPLTPLAESGSFTLAQIAPTEYDKFKRKTLVHGVVHDLNAWALDGVAGHAGLFSSARDMAVYGQAMLDAARGIDTPIFPDGSFAKWINGERVFGRPFGWDVPTGPSSSAGRYFSRNSIGHTGFTGTSIWIDPDRDLFVVLLTNRLNPSASNQRHVRLRRELHDAVQLAITDMAVTLRD
jgi:CubicO group peptidase (beta-lactamase class C family)